MRFLSFLALSGVVASWDLGNFTHLVVFGNSYADESRWDYFVRHNGSAPPVEWNEPVVGFPGFPYHDEYRLFGMETEIFLER